MTPLIAWAMIDVLANITAYGALVGMAAFGFRHGVFLALLSALTMMTGFIIAVAMAPAAASRLESFGVEAVYSLPIAYLLILAVVLSVARVIAGALLTDEDVRFHPDVERFGGAAVGAFAGLILGGTLLVGWSMCQLPAGWRLNAPVMHFDSGARCLWMFARWIHADPEARNMMFQGDVIPGKNDPKPAGEAVLASEPFDDADGDWEWDESERFLDYDENKEFSLDQSVADHPLGKAGLREAGLADRYWLSAWRTLRVLHRPRITSAEFNASEQVARPGELIYKAEAVDPDEGDELAYSLSGEGDAALLQIDPKTGEVRFGEGPIDPETKKVCFTVMVKDRSSLSDDHKVEITLRPPSEAAP